MHFIHTKNLVYNPENLIFVKYYTNRDSTVKFSRKAFKETLMKYPIVEDISFIHNIPPRLDNAGPQGLILPNEPDNIKILLTVSGDHSMIETFGFKITEGEKVL